MKDDLFRQQAIAYQRDPVKGSLLLACAPSHTWFGALAAVVAIALIAYACIGEFSRKAHVKGFLAPNKGLVKVFPPVAGTLLERRVDEGQAVRRGDVLAVVSTERASLSVRAANDKTIELLREREASLVGELRSREAIDALRQQRLDDDLHNLEAEQRQLDAAIRTNQQRLESAERETARFSELEADGFVAANQVQSHRDNVLDLRGRLQELQRDRIALRGRWQRLRSERGSAVLEGDASRAALQRKLAEVRQELTSQQSNSDVVIAAPADGVVTTVLFEAGQHARPDAPLLTILPAGSHLEAKLLVPSHAIGFIAENQSVALRYAAFPYQRFGHYEGVVGSIARTLLLPGDTDLPLPLQEPAYLVTVSLRDQAVRAYGRSFALQAGMALDGDVMLDRRSVIEWIFDPLLSLVQRS